MEYLSRRLTEEEVKNNQLVNYLTERLLDRTRSVRLWNYHEEGALPGLYVICAPTTICGHCILSADGTLVSATIYKNYLKLFDRSTISDLISLIGKSIF